MAKIVENVFVVKLSVLRPDSSDQTTVVGEEFPALLENLVTEVINDGGAGVVVEVVDGNG